MLYISYNERRFLMIKNENFLMAVLLTIGGYISLNLGGMSVSSLQPDIAEIAGYIIPFIYLLLVKLGLKLKDNDDLTKVYDPNRPRSLQRFIITTIIGLIGLLVPIFFNVTESIADVVDKPLVENFTTILMQLIVLNLCIGLFEEGLFRNLIMKVLLVDDKKSTYIKTFFISSILFGLIHIINFTVATNRPIAIGSQVVYTTLIGMLMAGLYFKYRNFYSLVFIHALFDFISMISKLYGVNMDVATDKLPDITLAQGMTSIATMIPSAIIGLLLLYSFLKKNFDSKK